MEQQRGFVPAADQRRQATLMQHVESGHRGCLTKYLERSRCIQGPVLEQAAGQASSCRTQDDGATGRVSSQLLGEHRALA